ncbi:MAG: DMT family transporter [Thermoleophilia bacterium]|nr:DMT family transporter [Thermoleophilia bacterium]
MAAAFALASSLLWGGGDFLGGRATRARSVLVVLAWSQLAMLLLLWTTIGVLAATTDFQVPLHAVLVGALGGAAGVIGLGAFYRALAAGPMSVVPPIAAAGVALPVAVGLASGGTDASAIVVAGLVLAIVGIILASIGEGSSSDHTLATRIAPATLGLCLVAAIGFGLIFVAMDRAAGDDMATALVATGGVRAGSVLLVLGAAVASRARLRAGVGRRELGGFVVIGLLDTGANLCFAIAAATGELAIVAVLGSLYPAVTSGLAHVVLGERLGRVQLVGAACAIGGVMLLALR